MGESDNLLAATAFLTFEKTLVQCQRLIDGVSDKNQQPTIDE